MFEVLRLMGHYDRVVDKLGGGYKVIGLTSPLNFDHSTILFIHHPVYPPPSLSTILFIPPCLSHHP